MSYTIFKNTFWLIVDLNMWLVNNVRQISKHTLCIFRADPEWGAAHIISAMHQLERPLVWLELKQQDDDLSISYKLAEALERLN